jgi:hypothetical protein
MDSVTGKEHVGRRGERDLGTTAAICHRDVQGSAQFLGFLSAAAMIVRASSRVAIAISCKHPGAGIHDSTISKRVRAAHIRPAQSQVRANQLPANELDHDVGVVLSHGKMSRCSYPSSHPVLIRPNIALRCAGINTGPFAAYLGCTTIGSRGSAVREHWYFDFDGAENDQRWVWRRVASDGKVVSESARFRYYLDVLKDAERHGFTAPALFGKPARVGKQQ